MISPYSPTISSSRSSRVTRPAVPPNSSNTMAIWVRRERNWCSRSLTEIVSGTNRALAGQVSGRHAIGFAIGQEGQDVAHVQDADHVVQIILIYRQLGNRLVDRHAGHIRDGLVGLHGHDLRSRPGNLAHDQLTEIDHSREHLAFRFFDHAFHFRTR